MKWFTRKPLNIFVISTPDLAETHQYNTRRTNNIANIKTRTSFNMNSILSATINLWNNVPGEIRENSSKSNFKSYLNRNLKRVPKYFNFGSRKLQIIMARLRLQCSQLLKDHLFQKNVIDRRLCTCGEWKTQTITFFFV